MKKNFYYSISGVTCTITIKEDHLAMADRGRNRRVKAGQVFKAQSTGHDELWGGNHIGFWVYTGSIGCGYFAFDKTKTSFRHHPTKGFKKRLLAARKKYGIIS